jgi:hypothetical protein
MKEQLCKRSNHSCGLTIRLKKLRIFMPRFSGIQKSEIFPATRKRALNGGPLFSFSPAISFVVNCEAQKEVDRLWEKLSEGGEPGQCGWLKDRYGVSWQIVPVAMFEMLQDRDAANSERVMKAMLQMSKIDINVLKQAIEQR